jgi:hypothetical protein
MIHEEENRKRMDFLNFQESQTQQRLQNQQNQINKVNEVGQDLVHAENFKQQTLMWAPR